MSGDGLKLAAIEDPVARKAKFDEMVAPACASGKALPPTPVRTEKKLRWMDSW
jgi:hypothetical protein